MILVESATVRLDVPAVAAEVGNARRFVRAELAGVSPDVLSDVALATSELVTNAVEHGCGPVVSVGLQWTSSSIALFVESVGPAPQVGSVDTWAMSEVDQITGRGLGIVRSIADRVHIDRSDTGILITAHFDLP